METFTLLEQNTLRIWLLKLQNMWDVYLYLETYFYEKIRKYFFRHCKIAQVNLDLEMNHHLLVLANSRKLRAVAPGAQPLNKMSILSRH